MKTILVTGGSSGIGLESCRQLAALGNRIFFVGRNEERCMQAKRKIDQVATAVPSGFFVADLSSQKQIRLLSDEIHSNLQSIDVLLNNVGGVFSRFELSEDGLEKTIALNHFSYFLLTNLLIDLLHPGARIINMSSHSHYPGKIDFESFTKIKTYNILKAYNQSKLANVLFTYELADRLAGKNITVNAMHPGRVRTRIGNKNQPWYLSLGWSILTMFSSITPEESAKTCVFLALSDEVKNSTGKYFSFSREKKSSVLSYDKALARKLWLHSAEMTGLGG